MQMVINPTHALRRRLAGLLSAMLLVTLLCATVAAQEIEQKVEAFLSAHVNSGRFSGSVLIARGGKILVSKGYGMSNYELGVKNTPQTKFRLGSITKQFTATAIMQLQEKGLLSVDDPVTKYFPAYKNAAGVTIHHLLSHTSGIPNFTNYPDYRQTMMLSSPPEKTIEKFKDKALEFAPGEKWNYSNSGYILLGMIIEKVSGKSYEDYLKENVFNPLGMANTGYDHNATVIKDRASGYQLGSKGLVNAEYIDMTIPHAAGALYSTVEDLYTWDRALYTEKVLKKSSLEKMFTAVKSNYGYGWAVEESKGRKRISHGGGINGFATMIQRFVNDDAVIIVLNNVLPPAQGIHAGLASILFGDAPEVAKERAAIKVDTKLYDAYVGKYELAPSFIVTITKEGDRLFGQATGQPVFELFPESEAKFFLKVVEAQVTFVRSENGEVGSMILHQGGQNLTGKRIK
jgi:CubicO group peptidase (beta-lactamase class C family)